MQDPAGEAWVDAGQLERLIRQNMTCKYIPDRICLCYYFDDEMKLIPKED